MNLDIDDLGKLIADAQKQAEKMMSDLSKKDQQKVKDIVDSVNTQDIKEMETYLNKQKNAN